MPRKKNIEPEATRRSIYVFHNTEIDVNLYVNAYGADQAKAIFDACGFFDRPQWRIFLQLGEQPVGKR